MVLVLMTSFSFAETLTFLEKSHSIPEKLQGKWTQKAFSQNEGVTWIKGITVPIEMTQNTFKVGDAEATVIRVDKYKDEDGYICYVIQVREWEDLFELWLENDTTILMIIHKYRVESLRALLTR